MENYKEEIQYAMTRKDHIFYNEFYKIREHLTLILYKLINKCHNEKDPFYLYFGRKDINVCKEWRTNFNSFVGWALNNNYIIGMYIHRINIHQDYSPNNCIICTPERHEDLRMDLNRSQDENEFKYSKKELDNAIKFLENLRDK